MFKKGKVPHTYVIVFSIILISAMLTWIIPSGKYVKETKLVNGTEKQTVTYYLEKDIPATYELKVKSQPQTWQIFSALFKGFVKQSNIIAYTRSETCVPSNTI
jgi:uncharacterized ion transporter superfamily protein YfcC